MTEDNTQAVEQEQEGDGGAAQAPSPEGLKNKLSNEELERRALDLEKKLTGQVNRAEQKATEAQIFAQIMADPEMAAVVRAKQQKKQVKVVDVDADQPLPEDLDTIPTSKFAEIILQKTAQAAKAQVEQAMQPVLAELQGFRNFVSEKTKEESVRDVEALTNKHNDVDQYADDMLKLAAQHKSLKAEELYLLARAKRSGGQPPKQQAVESERPSSTGQGSALVTPKETVKFGRGEGGYNTGLRAAIAGLLKRGKLPVADLD